MLAAEFSNRLLAGPVRLENRPLLEGTVVHGDARGRTLGFPTANMEFSGPGLPAFGVYAVRVWDRSESSILPPYQGVASFGIRPMFRTAEPLLETHLFGFEGDLYGHFLSVELVAWLRPELKFEGLKALIAQIGADAAQAKTVLAEAAEPISESRVETVA